MSASAMETDKVINHTVKSLINNLNYQIFAKETLKKMPQHTFTAISKLRDNIIFVGNIPKPIYKRQPIMQQDVMPFSPPKEGLLTSKVPLRIYSQLQIKTPSSGYDNRRRNISRYPSTADKKQLRNQIHLDLSQIKQNKLIEVVNRSQQNTAKTYRSVIELDSQITEMRKTYLKNLKKQAQLKQTQSKQDYSLKKKKLPKEFTFDFSGELLQKRNFAAKSIAFSPLKTKSVGIQKIQKQVQKSRNNSEEESNNLQEILARAKTGSSQNKKREYNNLSQRQVSHIPYISLMQNIKIYQNDTQREGQSKNAEFDSTIYSSRKSSFMHYSQKSKEKDELNLNMTQQIFPKCFKLLEKQRIREGRITINKAIDIQNYDVLEDQIQDHIEKTLLNKKL